MRLKDLFRADYYIISCCIVLLLLLGLNSFFFILKEAFGYGEGTFLFSSMDRFADIIKLALSYKDVLYKIPNLNDNINQLRPIYQDYFYNNPYGGIANLDGLSHFHVTPLSTLLNIAVGLSIGRGITPQIILLFLFFSCLLLAYFSVKTVVMSYKKSMMAMLLILVSYPVIF